MAFSCGVDLSAEFGASAEVSSDAEREVDGVLTTHEIECDVVDGVLSVTHTTINASGAVVDRKNDGRWNFDVDVSALWGVDDCEDLGMQIAEEIIYAVDLDEETFDVEALASQIADGLERMF